MHKRLIDVKPEVREAPRGGKGRPEFHYMFTPEEMKHKLSMLARITLHPGDAIGYHNHTDDLEVYYVLEGSLDVNDNGTWFKALPGDVIFTADGDYHEVVNKTTDDAIMLAFIVP